MPLKNTGKTILKIKKYKTKIVLYFKDEKLDISYRDYTRFYLYPNKTLSDKEYKELLGSINRDKLLAYALSLVSKSAYSEYRIREKLYNKEAKKNDVDEIIKYLKDNHLINDQEFVKEFVRVHNLHHEGKNRIINKLLDKGIFMENIPAILFDDDVELEKAKYHIGKLSDKYRNVSSLQRRNKIYACLINMGFDEHIAYSALDGVSKISEKEEYNNLKKDYDKIKLRLSRKYRGEELKQKIINSLLNKGYKYNAIMSVVR